MGKADLHIHTTASDGHMSPSDILELAEEKNLDFISITDHDTLKGYRIALKSADKYSVELLPGVEITADFNGEECHLLAYCFDPDNKAVKQLLSDHNKARTLRGQWIIDQLAKKGIELDLEEVKAEANWSNIGRPHIAAVLVNKGFVASKKEAFIRYLSNEALGEIKNNYYSHLEIIEIVKKAGGAVVIAHPGKIYSESELEELVDAGADGVEVMHPSHDYSTQKRIENFADHHSLLKTGGSDFHGDSRNYHSYFGIVTISETYVHRMMRMTEQRKQILVT